MKYLLAFTALIAVATAASINMAPLMGRDHPDVIPGEYVVVFHKNVSDSTIDRHHSFLAQEMAKYADEEMTVKFKYSVLKGYSAKMNDRVRDRVRLLPEVKYVNTNQKVQLSQGEPCTTNMVDSWGVPRTTVTGRVPAGLDPYDYLYDLNCDGAGSDVYIIDTGIDLENTGRYFEGRAVFAVDFVGDGLTGDPNGHGTHVAGTVASIQYGLAPRAIVHAVRVLNSFGSGSFDGVVAGVDYVPAQSGTRKIINMSLGGGIYTPLIDAIEDAYNAGVHVVVAAGNENTDACSRSPAAAPYATTVGASDDTDSRATFSNYGSCVEIFAPGVAIWAPYQNGIPAALSGTSMASPHVAGVVAKMLTNPGCRGNRPDDPQNVENYILEKALPDAVTGVPSGTSDLLHMPCET